MEEIERVLTEYGIITYDKSRPQEEQWEMAPKWPEKPYEKYDRYMFQKISESDYEKWNREPYNFEVAPLGVHKVDFENAPKMDSPEMTLWDIADEKPFDDFKAAYDKKYLNQKNSYGYSLLHEALHGRHVETFMFLINEGIDVNIQDKSGNTVLYYLVKEDMCEPVYMMILAVLTSGADVNIANNDGTTPLIAAFAKCQSDDSEELMKLKILLSKKNNPDIFKENRFGMSAKKLSELVKERLSQ